MSKAAVMLRRRRKRSTLLDVTAELPWIRRIAAELLRVVIALLLGPAHGRKVKLRLRLRASSGRATPGAHREVVLVEHHAAGASPTEAAGLHGSVAQL